MHREYYKKYELMPTASAEYDTKPKHQHSHIINTNENRDKDFLKNIGSDEFLIVSLILALITDDEPDFLTIASLVFILLS